MGNHVFSRKRWWGRIDITAGDEFLATSAQVRPWFFHRLLSETVADLEALDEMKGSLVTGSDRPLIGGSGWSRTTAEYGAGELIIAGQQVMQDWETPLMEAMADIAAAGHGDVLEVGFGMGISATMLQQRGIASHTIIELNDEVCARAEQWRGLYPGRDIRIVPGSWQDVAASLGTFDAIFYDVYPVTDLEVARLVQMPFPGDFFAAAASLLRPGGVFTYYTNEIDSLSRWHQRRLLWYFRRFTVEVVTGLKPPPDCHYWFAPSMAVVGATS